MNDSLLLKFKTFILLALTITSLVFYMKPVPDDGIVPIQTYDKVLVFSVKSGSEAFKKGIKPNFKIIGINHKLIKSIKEVDSLIKYPSSDYLFEKPDGELLELTLTISPVRRITYPEIVFIFISLLIYILSIALLVNNFAVKELFYVHSAIVITHITALAFIINPSYSAYESFLMLAGIYTFPFLPFLISMFVKTSDAHKKKLIYLLYVVSTLIVFNLLFKQGKIIPSMAIVTAEMTIGYIFLAYSLKTKDKNLYIPSWLFHISVYFGIITFLVLITLTKGTVIFGLLKLILSQQILLNALIIYVILKYGISDKKLVLKKSFVDAFIFLALLILYTSLIYFINRLIGENFIAQNLKLYSIMLGILIVFILTPINDWLKNWLEFLLFKQERKLASKVFELTDKMIGITDGEEIEKYMENLIKSTLKMDVEIFFSTDKNTFRKVNSHQVVEWTKPSTRAYHIEETPLQMYSNKGFSIVYPFREKEDFTVLVVSKLPLTVQQKKLLEHIFVQFGLTYQNIKLIEKAQSQIELERDLKIAGLIQKSLIPSFHPEGDNFEIYGISESAKTVGGDFFDYLPSEDNKVKVIVGDVAGKSVPAAIMMVSAKETIFSRSATLDNPSLIMNESNKLLYLRSNKNMFVACIYFVFDPSTEELEYINAGMPSPFIIRGNEITILKKQKTRFPLGLIPNVKYKQEKIKLHSGDTVIFMTDGITETLDDDIHFIIEQCSEKESALSIAQCIIDKVKEKTGNILEDDATVVVLKIRSEQ